MREHFFPSRFSDPKFVSSTNWALGVRFFSVDYFRSWPLNDSVPLCFPVAYDTYGQPRLLRWCFLATVSDIGAKY
jgi:hypothetical protein